MIDRIRRFFTTTDWINVLERIQNISAYLPIILVPVIFSPFSVDSFFVEKLFVILFFSCLSLLSLALRNLINYYSVQKSLALKKNPKKETYTLTFYNGKLFKYLFCFTLLIAVSTILSVNANLSLWGTGLVLFISLLIWLFSIYQVFDKKKITTALIIGISLVAVIDLISVITRYKGGGSLTFIQPFAFTPNGDLSSLLFILFVGIYFSLKSSFLEKWRYVNIAGLFLCSTAFIIFAYINNLYIYSYIALFLLFFSYIYENTNLNLKLNSILSKNKNDKKESKGNKKESKKVIKNEKNDINLKVIVIASALIVGIFELIFQSSILNFYRDTLSINQAWTLMFRALTDNIKNLLFGVGPNNYLYSYLHYKTVDINSSPVWANEYIVSPYGIFEIITDYGSLFLLILGFVFFKRRKNTDKKNLFKTWGWFQSISFIFIFLFALITPWVLVSIWIILLLVVLIYSEPTQKTLNLSLSRLVNGKNENKDISYKFNIFVMIFVIPIFILSLLFYLSSTFIFFGSKNHNMGLIDNGMKMFAFYPKSYSKVVDSLSSLKTSDTSIQYASLVQDYARNGLQLNPADPTSNFMLINSLTSGSTDYNSLSLAVNFYNKLISISPNHIPYYINLSDLQTRQGSYLDAQDTLDKALQLNSKLDITLLRRSNVAFFLQKYSDAQKYAEQVLMYSNNESLKNAANNILAKVKSFTQDNNSI